MCIDQHLPILGRSAEPRGEIGDAAYCRVVVAALVTNAAHGGDALRAYLAIPDLGRQRVRLPAYRPDDNGDEAIWKWAREALTASTGLAQRAEAVKSRCRTLLQKQAVP